MTADERAREIASGYLWAMDVNSFDELTADITAAIHEAAREAYERAAAIGDSRAARYKGNEMYPAYCLNGMAKEAEDIAAAIRQLKAPA